jgi:hypothetical protein
MKPRCRWAIVAPDGTHLHPYRIRAAIVENTRVNGKVRQDVRKKRGYSMRGIANELTKRKVQTPRGGSWHPQLVKRIVQRLPAS